MARTSNSSPSLRRPPVATAGASRDDSANKWADSIWSSLRTFEILRNASEDGWISRPCSSQVYQLTLTPASTATSSRRKPGVRRGPTGKPYSAGCKRARRLLRKLPSSRRCSGDGRLGMGYSDRLGSTSSRTWLAARALRQAGAGAQPEGLYTRWRVLTKRRVADLPATCQWHPTRSASPASAAIARPADFLAGA